MCNCESHSGLDSIIIVIISRIETKTGLLSLPHFYCYCLFLVNEINKNIELYYILIKIHYGEARNSKQKYI